MLELRLLLLLSSEKSFSPWVLMEWCPIGQGSSFIGRIESRIPAFSLPSLLLLLLLSARAAPLRGVSSLAGIVFS